MQSLLLPQPTRDEEAVLDFTLNQSETEQQFEADVFRGFSTEECEGEASHFEGGPSKIYLKDEIPAESSQTVPDAECMEVEDRDLLHLSNYTDMNFSCLEHNNVFMNGCEYSPSYSCRRGYLSSDSDDEEECCQPYLQASSSYLVPACCADNLNPNPGSQGNPKQKHIKPSPLTPLLKPENFRDTQKVIENMSFPVLSPQAQCAQTCKCQKIANETREAGTQTAAETCDAEIQCSVVEDRATTEFNLPPVVVSVQHPPTGRQTDAAAESTHTPPTGKATSGDKLTPWLKKTFKAGSLSDSSIINIIDGKVIQKRPKKHFLDAPSVTDVRGKGRDEGERQENGRLVKDLSNEAREEVTSATRANRLSEEAETLQEIAGILLLLKQRKEVK
ncbi:uncharacterized protein LOC134879077 isoform X1 [Eleginops maclovinus]|uniref:uncharacterized protein LOC134879077 isoform X1 n=1 Tax=Eleginops maclovinus TaxID=56733 RepID=UPI0030807FC5